MRKLLEPLLMFSLIVGYIWKLRFTHPYSWIVIPAQMFFSNLWHGESAAELGFRLRGLAGLLKKMAPLLALIAIVLLSMGAVLHTIRRLDFAGVLLSLAAYLPWGLAQQYMLNGYFLHRFDAALASRAAGILAASLFCAVHAPNPFLMAITLPLGWCAVLVYRRTHNLYLLGIAHAVIGFLLFLVVPDSISHHLRIGPGWFRP